MIKLKVDRIISIATLVASLIAIVLVLKKPAPVSQPQPPAIIAQHAQSFDQKMTQFAQAMQQTASSSDSSDGSSKTEVHISSDEASAVLAQALGASQAGALPSNTYIGTITPTIKDQRVSFDGDIVHGQFLTEIAGKDVWITISGHLGEKDGYATFDPTEFKFGDLNVPVSIVNPELQKKLAEQRDQLKLPDGVGNVQVENGELVMQQK